VDPTPLDIDTVPPPDDFEFPACKVTPALGLSSVIPAMIEIAPDDPAELSPVLNDICPDELSLADPLDM
jgi:hypothetical protein